MSSNQTLETLKFVHEENRMAKVIRFSIETIQGMDFEKLQVTFLAKFFHKQLIFFNGSKKNRFFLIFVSLHLIVSKL